jgi:hypothetical protein
MQSPCIRSGLHRHRFAHCSCPPSGTPVDPDTAFPRNGLAAHPASGGTLRSGLARQGPFDEGAVTAERSNVH